MGHAPAPTPGGDAYGYPAPLAVYVGPERYAATYGWRACTDPSSCALPSWDSYSRLFPNPPFFPYFVPPPPVGRAVPPSVWGWGNYGGGW